jgi:S1-C subfamily serine protease
VAPGSPAAKANLAPGDVILQAGTRTIHNEYDWQAVLLGTHVGDHVHLRVRRGSRQFETDVLVVDLPEATAPKVQVLRDLELTTVTPAIRASRSIRSQNGALVTKISQPAADALGVQVGDVIIGVNNRRVTSADDVARAFDDYGGRVPMRLIFERAGQLYQTDYFTVQ